MFRFLIIGLIGCLSVTISNTFTHLTEETDKLCLHFTCFYEKMQKDGTLEFCIQQNLQNGSRDYSVEIAVFSLLCWIWVLHVSVRIHNSGEQAESSAEINRKDKLPTACTHTHTVAADALKYLLTRSHIASPAEVPEILPGGWVDNLHKKSGANVADIFVLTCHCSGTSLEHFRTSVNVLITQLLTPPANVM